MEPARSIVFVCQHGAAKSVIAAAYANRLAAAIAARVVRLLDEGEG